VKIDLTEISVVLGQKNSGKSVLIEHLLTRMRRYVVLDPNHEHGPPKAAIAHSPAELLSLWMTGETRIVVRDAPLSEEKAEEYMRAFGQLQRAYLVIDEAHNYMSYSYIPDTLKHLVKWHVTHNNCGIVLGAHKAKEIHDQIWTQTDNYMIFSYGEHEDSKLAEASIPSKRQVHDLDPDAYQFLWYKDVSGAESEVRGPVPVPEHLS
jgi:GTP-binding protein EngB required for normal cell division